MDLDLINVAIVVLVVAYLWLIRSIRQLKTRLSELKSELDALGDSILDFEVEVEFGGERGERIKAIKEQRMRERRDAAKAEAAMLQCPRCDGKLVELKYEEVLIDRCNKCNGVWLDAGELEQIVGKEEEGGFLSRMWRGISSD